jgi:hypothetical protein
MLIYQRVIYIYRLYYNFAFGLFEVTEQFFSFGSIMPMPNWQFLRDVGLRFRLSGCKPIHPGDMALAVYHNFGLKVDPVLLLSQGTGPTFKICCGRRIWLFIGIPVVRRHDWSDKFSKMFSSERDFSILLLMISSVLKRMMASCRGRAQDRGFMSKLQALGA